MPPHDPRFEGLDRLSGRQFEDALVDLFTRLGFADVTRVGGYDDMGADILAVDDGARVAIQAKRWSRPVRLDAIRALLDGIARHDCARGIAVTTNFFTDQARECAAAHGIELWDRWKLGEFVAGDAPVVDRGVCAECGTAVSEGITRFCTAHPARFDGHVYCLHHQKRANRSI